jgi:myo-inositol-1(or 4)-monophosphatase
MRLKSLEKKCINACRHRTVIEWRSPHADDPAEWLRFGLTVLFKIGSMIRSKRLRAIRDQVHFKEDGSPATKLEEQIEAFVRQDLSEFSPEAQLIGEESGGIVPAVGVAVAIDPIDGTWSYLNRTETCATSLVFLRDQKPFLGMVMNPVTGEVGYAFFNSRTRLIQFSIFGEEDMGWDLPLDRVRPDSALINVHPQRHAGSLVDKLFQLWNESGLNMVRMSGGSPSYALLETAKGSFNYINLWSKQVAAPYDLAAGILLVRRAGGDVIDLSGSPIRDTGHSGPFIAGLDADLRQRFMHNTRQALKESDTR